MPRRLSLALASVLGALALPAAAVSPTYTAVDLGTLNGCTYTEANGINNSGQVAGYCYGATSGHGFVTGPDGQGMTDLGTLGGDRSAAMDINNAGQVVGTSNVTLNGMPHAFVTGPDGINMVDLNALVDLPGDTYFTYAKGINDKGQIIAQGSDDHAYLISPWTVPEPETMALVLTGLGLVSVMARSRKGRSLLVRTSAIADNQKRLLTPRQFKFSDFVCYVAQWRVLCTAAISSCVVILLV